jgi:hypothetical protein
LNPKRDVRSAKICCWIFKSNDARYHEGEDDTEMDPDGGGSGEDGGQGEPQDGDEQDEVGLYKVVNCCVWNYKNLLLYCCRLHSLGPIA